MFRSFASLTAGPLLAMAIVFRFPSMHTTSAIPPVWNIFADSFENGYLDAWGSVSPDDLVLVAGGGRSGSTGLAVMVGQHESYLYREHLMSRGEGYLHLWFNPNGVSISDEGSWIPSKSIRIATVMGSSAWHEMVALRLRKPNGQGYKAYLSWHAHDGIYYDFESGEFAIADGWQQITLGFHVDEWIAVWVNGVLVREIHGITHEELHGDLVGIGKIGSTSVPTSGEMRFDEVAFQIPRTDDVWVDAVDGDDANDGLTPISAFRTIQKAADLAGPGTTVHILPGVYRETVQPAMSGSDAETTRYVAENGPGTVIIRGSEPASSVAWTQLTSNAIGLPPGVDPTNIYYTSLAAWELDSPPRFVVELDGNGQPIARLPLAREPDWPVTTDWKYHEYWWSADGGWDVAGCDPPTDVDPFECDYASRSTTQLTDRSNDSEPPGVEEGNLATLGSLVGGTLVAVDTRQGHYVYRRSIVAHDVPAGRVTVDQPCEHDVGSGDPGLGWGSKYYVEGKPFLLDEPGEWWYDIGTGRLYLWPHTPGNPATMNIEISRRDHGFHLQNRSYTILDGLIIELLNGNAINQINSSTERSYGNVIRNTILRFSNRGIWLTQYVQADSPPENHTEGFVLEDSEIAYMDTQAIHLAHTWQGGTADSFTHPGIYDTIIRRNELHHLGFRADGDGASGTRFVFPHRLRFEDNHVHHVSHNGVQLMRSVVQSPSEYGFAPDEIKIGEILIKDNVFEKACQLTTDCGALKISGSSPQDRFHVFRELLIVGNIFRDTFGWTSISDKRGRWTGGINSEVRGMGGFGLYVDMASGIHAYRNIAYNNAYIGFLLAGVWRDGDIVYYNNVAANSLYGIRLGGPTYDTHDNVNTRVANNVIVNNEGYGIQQTDADGIFENMTIDHNLYFNNGWRPYGAGGVEGAGAMTVTAPDFQPYATLADIQANTEWEDHGVAGDPNFWNYDVNDHELDDGSWPSFHLTVESDNAIDGGTGSLPVSLENLLHAFAVYDPVWGVAPDIGRYEAGFALLSQPSAQAVEPGGVAHYILRLHPDELPYSVQVTVASPSINLLASLNPEAIAPRMTSTLIVTHTQPGQPVVPGMIYTVPLTGTGGGFVRSAIVGLLVGGVRHHLPLVMRSTVP